MSEQKAEQTRAEPGSLNAGLAALNSSEAQWEQAAALALEINAMASPRIAPDHEAPKADEPKVEAPKVEASKAETSKSEAPKIEAPKIEAFKVEASKVEASKGEASKAETPKIEASKIDAPQVHVAKSDTAKPDTAKPDTAKPNAPRAGAPRSSHGRLVIMPAGGQNWDRAGARSGMESESSQGLFGKHRLSALAAVVALAVVAGAIGGALLTASLTHLASDGTAGAGSNALEASVARIDAEILALKAGVEHVSQVGVAQINKTSDRLDRVEKAQTEPLAKLARLSESVDKLRAAPVASVPVAAAPAAAKEVTGSIAPPTPASAAAAPKVEVSRLPTVEGWVLRDIANGSALIEGRHGMYEVYAGDPIPGLGRVEAIRRQDGRWVVVTSKGLITAR